MKFFCGGLSEDLVRRSKKELGEAEDVKSISLDELKELIKVENDLNCRMDDIFLLRFLRKNKFEVKKAFKDLQKYYRFKAKFSGIYTDFKPSDVRSVLEEGNLLILENRAKDHTSVCYVRNAYYDYKNITPAEMMAAIFVISEVGLEIEATQVTGYHLIFDLSNITLSLMKQYAHPVVLYNLITGIQDFIPCRIKALHIVNQPATFSAVYKMVEFFLPDKIKSRVHFHGDNLRSLYNHVPQDILPQEIGGHYGSMAKHSKEFIAKIMCYEEQFTEFNKYGYTGDTLQQLQK